MANSSDEDVNVTDYNRMVHTQCLSRLLAEGMDDIRAGRTIPLEDFVSEFKRVKKIPPFGIR